jgi:hypothetical protein
MPNWFTPEEEEAENQESAPDGRGTLTDGRASATTRTRSGQVPAGNKKNSSKNKDKKMATAPASNAPASAANVYAGIAEAKQDTRFPWFDKTGRYLVTTIGWRAQINFNGGKPADVWDIEVLHTYRGEAQPGEKYTRMRVRDQWGTWLNEVKTRAVTLLTIFAGQPVAAAAVDVAALQAITEGGELMPGVVIEGNGKVFFGQPIVVEVMPAKANTRSAGTFTPVNYFVPTAADLAAAGIAAG